MIRALEFFGFNQQWFKCFCVA